MSTAVMENEPCGVLAVYKPAGFTSHDVVNLIRKYYHTKRVGHAGTLDPMAEGVLLILIGRAAKANEYLSGHQKSYRATLRLGITTDTEDTTGTVLTTCENLPSAVTVQEVCSRFVGELEQIPPMYSALKVNGQKLVDLARKGQIVERTARRITVSSLTCTPTETPSDYCLEVVCSGGTYIRTLCADIGAALGCGGTMAALLRTSVDHFTLQDCVTLDLLQNMEEDKRLSLLSPTEALFAGLPQMRLPAFFERLSRSGCEIYQNKVGTAFLIGQRVRMCTAAGEFYALGEVREYPEGSAVKAIKLFSL